MAKKKSKKEGAEMYPGCGFTQEELLEDLRRNLGEYRVRKAYWVYINEVFGLDFPNTLGFVSNRARAVALAGGDEKLSISEHFVLRRGKFYLSLDNTVLARLGKKIKESVQEAEYGRLIEGSGIREGD